MFQVAELSDILVQTLFHYRDRKDYLLHEFVVMPNHFHVLVTPSATTSLEKAVQLIKGGSSHAIHKQRQQRMEIWQEGFHDWTIRDAVDWVAKAAYIRANPVRAKLVAQAEEWPYCSANGRYELDAVPERFRQFASGAKAPINDTETPGLKPRPPKEFQA